MGQLNEDGKITGKPPRILWNPEGENGKEDSKSREERFEKPKSLG